MMEDLLQLEGLPARQEVRSTMTCASGHAGEFLQGAISYHGTMERILVSIPAAQLTAHAIFNTTEESGLRVEPAWKKKGLQAFELTSLRIAAAVPNGILQLYSNIPIARGLGSSTADCVAAIRTAAFFWQIELSAVEIAQLAHEAECFSDSTMFDRELVVFEHCNGRLLERLSGAVPHMRMLVVEDAVGKQPIDTDTLLRPQYTAQEMDDFAQAIGILRRALAQRNLDALADVAWLSAQINQRYFPKPRLHEAQRIARATGGLGVAIAHSGDAMMLLYPESIEAHRLEAAMLALDSNGLRCWQQLTTF